MLSQPGIKAAVLLLALLLPVSSLFADKPSRSGSVGLGQSVDQIRGKTGGRVLSAETRNDNGRDVHHIRILTDQGKVRRYRLDAESGREINRSKRNR